MSAPKEVLRLIERFERNRDAYRSSDYNEAGTAEAYGSLQPTETYYEESPIQRQIDATDKQIDQLVYELYSFTKEEIKIVEESI